jgi:hypothetical protein
MGRGIALIVAGEGASHPTLHFPLSIFPVPVCLRVVVQTLNTVVRTGLHLPVVLWLTATAENAKKPIIYINSTSRKFAESVIDLPRSTRKPHLESTARQVR